MGYATYSAGYKGIVRERGYKSLIACDVVPAVLVDGVPTSWKRVITTAVITETVKEFVGLSYSDAHDTGEHEGVTFSPAVTYSSGDNPIETYSREVERLPDGDSMCWTVRITEKSATLEVTS